METTNNPEMYVKNYDYTNYSHRNNINVIPEEDFKRLVADTFRTLADNLRNTYGPYGSYVMMSEQSQTITTKDGYNVYQQLALNHTYKRLVYLAINKIITRVNNNVGDGTTSCILLAEKVFNNINNIINTPDDKRNIMPILTDIEKYLQNIDIINSDVKKGLIKPLTSKNIKPVIGVAANYDKELVDILYSAMSPEDIDGNIKVRSVGVRKETDDGIGTTTKYEIDYLPGDFRVGVNPILDDVVKFNDIKKIKCVIYDHNFNATDWTNFMAKFNDDEEVMIVTRDINKDIIENEYISYRASKEAKRKLHMKDCNTNMNIYIFSLFGSERLNEINDLAAVIGTKPRGLYDKEVDFSKLPYVEVSLYKKDCLTFHNLKGKVDTTDYCESLRDIVRKDESHSLVKKINIEERITAIKMEDQETLLSVTSESSLDSKLIGDKIDDCIRIVKSASNSGVVPNLFRYVYDRITEYAVGKSVFVNNICDSIKRSIEGLFTDIWISKYGYDVNGVINEKESLDKNIEKHFHDKEYTSFDIINVKHTPIENFATSAQYDLEVTSAALAIVKYLLTSRALIFDAHILKPVNDEYNYTEM